MALPQTNIPQIQTVVLQAGQSAYIPVGATILSIDGDATLASDCLDLTPKPLKCFEIVYTMSADGNTPTDAWAYEDPNNRINGIYVNGIEYACDFQINSDIGAAVAFLVAKGSGAIIDAFEEYVDGGSSDKFSRKITFKAPAQIGPTVYFSMSITTAGSANPGIIRVYAKEIDCVDIL